MVHPMKIVGIVALGVFGLVALFVGIEWLTQPIHSLPAYLGGHTHKRGRYSRRGDALLVVGIAALAIAGYLIWKLRSAHPSGTDSTTPAQ